MRLARLSAKDLLFGLVDGDLGEEVGEDGVAAGGGAAKEVFNALGALVDGAEAFFFLKTPIRLRRLCGRPCVLVVHAQQLLTGETKVLNISNFDKQSSSVR